MTETRTATITLGQAWRTFYRYTTSRVMTPLVVAAWTARIVLGGFRWWDLVVVLLVLALQAFVEWSTHVAILHFRPRTVRGRTFDLYIAKKHRAHHADPKDLPLVFIPTPVFLQLIVGDPVIFLLAIPSHTVALTAIASTYTMLFVYEWTHFLIHSPYRPKRWYYSYVRRAHWNHHYKNEHYWFGITVHIADHLFRTFPDKAAVETSPTARTLGIT